MLLIAAIGNGNMYHRKYCAVITLLKITKLHV